MTDKVRDHELELADKTTCTFPELLKVIESKLIKERVELFVLDGKIRPGILVLINDTDWEVTGGDKTVIEDKDSIVFISTLHGG